MTRQDTPQHISRRRGFSLIELLVVIAIVLILIAIAIPNAHKYLMSAHELAAIRQIGAIHQAQTHYYSQFGKYAAVLADLGPPTSGADGSSGADLIPRNLAAGKNSGYIFQVAGSSAGYTVTAVPESFGGSGARTFYSDQSMAVRNNRGPDLLSNSPQNGAPGQLLECNEGAPAPFAG